MDIIYVYKTCMLSVVCPFPPVSTLLYVRMLLFSITRLLIIVLLLVHCQSVRPSFCNDRVLCRISWCDQAAIWDSGLGKLRNSVL